MSTLSQFGFGGGIKSIQEIFEKQVIYNSVYTWGTSSSFLRDITINSVNVNKTILIYDISDGVVPIPATVSNFQIDGFSNVTGNSITLLNSTTVRVSGPSITGTSYGAQPACVNIQVVEFY